MIKKWLAVLVFIAVIGGISWWYWQSTVEKPVEVETVKVEQRDLNETISGSGVIQPDRQVQLLPSVADEITEVYVKDGDMVEEDDDLVKFKRVGKQKASIDGMIIQLNAAVGQTAVPGNPLLTVADFDPTYFIANIDEGDIAKVKAGQKCEIVLDAYPDETVLGDVVEVSYVSQQTAGGGTAFPVKIQVTDNKGLILRLGMNGDVDITIDTKKEVTAVSLKAVTTRDGKDTAFVADDNKVKKRQLTLGIATDEHYEVIKGLKKGEKVITNNLTKLKGGEEIK